MQDIITIHSYNKSLEFSSITLTLSQGWWGRCENNYLPKEEGRVGGEKSARARRGSPSCMPLELFRHASLSVAKDRLGYCTTPCAACFKDHHVLHVLKIVSVRFCKILGVRVQNE